MFKTHTSRSHSYTTTGKIHDQSSWRSDSYVSTLLAEEEWLWLGWLCNFANVVQMVSTSLTDNDNCNTRHHRKKRRVSDRDDFQLVQTLDTFVVKKENGVWSGFCLLSFSDRILSSINRKTITLYIPNCETRTRTTKYLINSLPNNFSWLNYPKKRISTVPYRTVLGGGGKERHDMAWCYEGRIDCTSLLHEVLPSPRQRNMWSEVTVLI